MVMETARWRPGEILYELPPSVFRAGVTEAMGRLPGGKGGRRNKTNIGGENDKGHEA
jgi:hypothetical protein